MSDGSPALGPPGFDPERLHTLPPVFLRGPGQDLLDAALSALQGRSVAVAGGWRRRARCRCARRRAPPIAAAPSALRHPPLRTGPLAAPAGKPGRRRSALLVSQKFGDPGVPQPAVQRDAGKAAGFRRPWGQGLWWQPARARAGTCEWHVASTHSILTDRTTRPTPLWRSAAFAAAPDDEDQHGVRSETDLGGAPAGRRGEQRGRGRGVAVPDSGLPRRRAGGRCFRREGPGEEEGLRASAQRLVVCSLHACMMSCPSRGHLPAVLS